MKLGYKIRDLILSVKLGKKRLATCEEKADSPQLIRANGGACLFVWSNCAHRNHRIHCARAWRRVAHERGGAMPMPMPPPPPSHPQRRDSLEDALSLGQGADTKPLASVPKASSTPRRQFITSLVSELDFGSIPGLGPAPAAAMPAQDSAATAAPAAASEASLALPLHPAPAPRKPKPALVPSFDFSQLPDYAGPPQSISVEPQPKGGSSFQASSSSSADALSSPPQPQPRPPQLPPRQSKPKRKSAAGAGEQATVGSKSAAPRASPVKGASAGGPAVTQLEARQPEARHAATAAAPPKEGGRPPRRQGGGGLDFLARLELVEQQEVHQEQHIPRSTEAPAGATVSPRPKPALEASTAGPSAPPPLPLGASADQLSQPLSKSGPLGRRFTPPMHSASSKPPGAATAKGASKGAMPGFGSVARVPQRSQSAALLRSSGAMHPFMRSGSSAASAASAANAASAASAAKPQQDFLRKSSPAAGARQQSVIGKGGPAAAAANQSSVARKGSVAAGAKQGSIDGRNGGLAAGASGAGRGAAGGGRGGRGRWVPTPSPVERATSGKVVAQPSAAPKRPSLAQSMGSEGEPSGGGSVPQKRQSSAAIPNGKHPKQKTTS